MNYPNRIRELRLERRLTTIELAERAHTSNQQIGRLERGERRLTHDWMSRISLALGCDTWDLLPESPTLSDEERDALEDLKALDPETRRSYLNHLRQLARLARNREPTP